MRLSSVCIFSILLGAAYAYISPNVYRRILRREGIPEQMIPHKELEQLARRVDRAQDDIDIKLAEAEFMLAVRKSYRWRFPRIDQSLARVNRIFRWGVTFQTQLGRLISAFNLPLAAGYSLFYNIRRGYQRESVRYDGDFSKIHKALERSLLREAAKYLAKPQLRELQRRISELNQREHNNIKLAYELTRKD